MENTETKERKSGMYGEMPIINIGKFTIAEMSNDENCTTVWIQDTEGGEGGEFSKESLAEILKIHFNKFF